MKRLLIVSDGRRGHENQSVALAKHLGADYRIFTLPARPAMKKAWDQLQSRFVPLSIPDEVQAHFHTGDFDAVVGAGSATYGMVLSVAERYGIKSVAMMLPKGSPYEKFDIIFAQSHDMPPQRDNLIEIPANFSYVEPQGIYEACSPRSIGIVIGGDNSVFSVSKERLQKQLEQIIDHYSSYEIAVTTSPRTSVQIEEVVASYGFDYEVLYSQKQINPIPDFLAQCERVFITADSTSMISEAVSFGNASIEILPLRSSKANKFDRFISQLEEGGYVHLFDGTVKDANRKIDFSRYLEESGL